MHNTQFNMPLNTNSESLFIFHTNWIKIHNKMHISSDADALWHMEQ